MNCSSTFRRLVAVILLLTFVPSAQALDIDTIVGNGADAEIANDGELFGDPNTNSDDPQGGRGSMNIRFLPVFDPYNERYRASLMRFDITGVSGDLSGGGISFQSAGSSRNVHVYALNDTAEAGIEDWDEATVTFDTAPGIVNMGELVVERDSGVVDPNYYTFLTEWRIQGAASDGTDPTHVFTSYLEPETPEPGVIYTRDAASESNCTADTGCIDPNFGDILANTIAADTNGLLTLLFFPKGDSQSSGNPAIRTKEWSTIYDAEGDPIPNPGFTIAPTLNLPNATISSGDPADLNMDGFVDGLDLGILLGNWDGIGIPPSGGELNDTDPVDGLDLGILLGAWNPPALAAASAAVPEPTTSMLITIALIGLLAGRTTTVRRSQTLASVQAFPMRSR
ncbi:MAG: hypothetical protein ABGX16_00065 [Pirellulales bacterium]